MIKAFAERARQKRAAERADSIRRALRILRNSDTYMPELVEHVKDLITQGVQRSERTDDPIVVRPSLTIFRAGQEEYEDLPFLAPPEAAIAMCELLVDIGIEADPKTGSFVI